MAKQDIPIALLRPGMFVVGIDVSWLDSPFLRHSFKIQDPRDIVKLRDAGVKIVTIERDKKEERHSSRCQITKAGLIVCTIRVHESD